MNDIAIRVENLSKLYRLGQFVGYGTLRESLVNAFSAPFRRLHSTVTDGGAESRNLDSEYIWALKDVSFEVKQGEAVGIIGRNGAGKTTLLKVLCRITEPTEGYAEIRGRVGSLLEVGTGFHGELTGRENIYLNGAVLGMKRREIDRKFDEIVDFAGEAVKNFIDTPLKRYSSGMNVRLAFAVAAHLEPEILLVDEVLAVGDIAFRKKCLGKMGDVAKGGRTVLFVSHQLEMVAELCPRCLLLENGHIILDGDSRTVIDTYYSSIKEASTTSLRERTDRQGRGRFRFVETWVEDEKGNRVTTVISGKPIKIVALYETRDGEELKDLNVGIAISTIRNPSLTGLGSSVTGQEFAEIPKAGRIECIIPKLPLNSGAFTYNLMARSTRPGEEIEDWVQQAGMFDVEPGDYYGSGLIPGKQFLMLIEHKWKIIEK